MRASNGEIGLGEGNRDGEESASAKAREEMGRRIVAIETAAREWGVQADHPEGRFIGALLTAIRWLSDVIVAGIVDIKDLLRSAKGASEIELAKIREMSKLAQLAIDQAQISLNDNVVMREEMIGKIVEHSGREIAEKLKPWLVMRETKALRNRSWRLSGLVSACAVMLVMGGFSLGRWVDSDASEAGEHCIAARVVAVNTGQSLCPLAAVVKGWKEMPRQPH